ncbi:unnamed protein product [Cunninghamella echinulata]
MADVIKQLSQKQKQKQEWKLYYLEKNVTKLDYVEFTKILEEIDFEKNSFPSPGDFTAVWIISICKTVLAGLNKELR